jgi:hypothetical protein
MIDHTNHKINKEENDTDANSFKKIVFNCMSHTTIHGLPHFVKSTNYLLRTLWIICITLCISACGYLIYGGINDYLKYDVVTKTRVYKDTKITYPMITLCPTNPIFNNNSYQFLKKFAGIRKRNFSDFDSLFDGSTSYNFSIALLDEIKIKWYDSIGDKFGKELNYSSDSFILNCFYTNDPDACTIVPTIFYSKRYGHCFQLNSGTDNRPLMIIESSKSNLALSFELFLGNLKNYNSFAKSNGLYIFITDQTDLPDYSNRKY